jgi:hypothetical protein
MDQDEALKIVRSYGLDRALTDEDDPVLWASALQKHWGSADDPEASPSSLRFAVLDFPENLESPGSGESHASPSGLKELEVWRFERNAMGLLQARRRKKEPEPFLPRDYLDVTRPSVGVSLALVHRGSQADWLAGSGQISRWERAPDGSWSEVGGPVIEWIS